MVGARRVVTARLDGGEVGSSAQFGAKGTYFWLVRRWSDAGQKVVRRFFFTQNVTVVFAVYVRNTQAMRHLSNCLLRNWPYVNVGARGSANSLDSERTKDVRKQICGGLA
jgi:hypothetical protein